ncbi:MAG TPA: DNA replication and repair protein RecF [Solirubrobacteraceae bacterium]|jgi:DNA replication and repair protein RecF|nr:DNA replication and repair protein RecF [Solirubrobacteraceae bacterium]
MRVERLQLRDFRSYEDAAVTLGPGLTVIHGPNGAGKTNLLEALYFGCTARSCRTTNERALVRFGAATARVVVDGRDGDGSHQLTVGFEPGEPKRLTADGAPVQRLLDAPHRPLICVFLPDRLELVKGPPGLRRAHLDQVVAALWPGRSATRRAYAQALAQRNALISRVRSGASGRAAVAAWDLELATHGVALRDDRAAATSAIAELFRQHAEALGLGGPATVSYRPRTHAATAVEFAAELSERLPLDLDRGFTGHGPHRDDLLLRSEGRELRAYGSQGQQRLALLSLLLAERDALSAARDRAPLVLLDDVMSELDGDRRRRLADELRSGGQAVVTTTDLDHVPGARDGAVARVAVTRGSVLCEAVAA